MQINKKSLNACTVSILTPTFNRAHKIGRLYASIESQTAVDQLEWVIVDDGSTDDTRKAVLSFQQEAVFPIRYQRQENAGKHVAVNRLFELAEGKYSLIIDDDDELLPDAIERFLKLWDRYQNNDNIWCICGRCVDADTKEMAGGRLPKNINDIPWKRRKEISERIGGERCGLARTDALRLYRYPEDAGMKFIPEGYVWKRLDAIYEQIYVNDIFRIYHQNEGESLMNRKKTKERYESDFIMFKYILGDAYLRPKRGSRLYFIRIYEYRLSKVRAGRGVREFYAPLCFLDKMMVWFTRFPCFILRVLRRE